MADETNIEYTASQMANFQENINIDTRDLNSYLAQVFNYRPELEFYYKGYSSSSIGSHHEVEFTYDNTDIPAQDIYYVKSNNELNNILTRAILYSEENICIVSAVDTDIQEIIKDIVNDNQIIAMGYKGFSSSSYKSGITENICYDIEFSYTIAPETLIQYKYDTEAAAIDFVAQNIAKSMADYEKELIIHDYITENTEYSDENGELSYLPYDALINGKGVCSAYALSAKILFDLVGIENIYVSGTGTNTDGTENHGWNIVNIQGDYYHLDLTWDDPVSDFSFYNSNINYDYFNITDEEISKDHTWDKNDYPHCTSTEYSYDNIRNLESRRQYNDYYKADDFISVFEQYEPLSSDESDTISELSTSRESQTRESRDRPSRGSFSIPTSLKIIIAVILVLLLIFAALILM